MAKRTEIRVGNRSLSVSNLEKELYPEPHFTKAQVIDFYAKISPVLLPHLACRPVTLKRYPDGVDGFFFYEKQCPAYRPDWIKTTSVVSHRESKHIHYLLIDSLPALIWAANLANLELHPFLHRAGKIPKPTALAFDLDPGPPADIVLCCQVGLWLRDVFTQLGLESFAKTSGSKGLQIFVPLNTPVTYDQTKNFAHRLAQEFEKLHPEQVVSQMQKTLRPGKVLIDWSQNDEHKTTVCVYSLRARARPTVSTPVTWEEVGAALKAKSANRLIFTSDDVLARVEKYGDLFAPVLERKQKLPCLE